MKKHFNFKSMYRAALVALCLLTVGVGNAWAGTKRIYCEYSGVSNWWGTVYVYAWGGGKDAKKYTMVATGTTNLVRCDIDDYHTDLLFYKSSTQGGSWETQSVDVSISSNNRWSLGDGGYGNKATISNQQRYAPGTAIDGLVDIKNPHNQMFTDGEYSVTLEAHKTYELKILETSTLYGLNDLIATSSISNQTLNTSGYQVRLCTAGAGTYTFAYNTTNHQLSITYPMTSHPSIDYCYVIDYSWSPSANLHLWNGTSTKVAEWNGESTIQGSTWPGAAISNKTTINGQSYFYIAPGEFDYFMLSKSGDSNDRSGEIQPSDGYGKRRYWKDVSDGWIWDTFTVRIQLNDLTATTPVDPNYMDVAFNSDVLTDLTTVPTKTHYDFGGFYTGYDEENEEVTGVQVINAAGEWIASVDDYTDASKHWIHAGMSTTLYAKWTQHPYDITLAVDPTGAGTVQIGGNAETSVNAHWVTESAEITAVPASPAYIFKEWQFSKTGEDYDVYVSDGETYHSTDPTIRVLAQHDGTLTAVFEPRFTLVGSIYDNSGNGGMPGWSDYTAEFEVTNSPFSATCTRKLDPNKTYKFEIHDRTGVGRNLGNTPDGGYLGDASIECNTPDRDIAFVVTGHGNYTFTISAVRQDGDAYYPTVSVRGPSSHLVNLSWADVDIDGNWWKTSRETGGTVAAETTESGDHYSIVNGQYVAAGGSITYTATPATGYTFGGWWNTDWSYNFNNTNPYTSSSISATENVEGKFVETSTTVTLANDGNGHVEIDDSEEDETTCGVTTTRELTAVPNEGYMFDNWTTSSSPDFEVDDADAATVTLTGHGAGTAGTLTANFTECWVLSAQSEGWGSTEFTIRNISDVSGDAVGYVDISLPANTNLQFKMVDNSTGTDYMNGTDKVYYMTYANHTDWGFGTDKTYNCGITTAGKGTYRFTWNITDKTMTVTYPNSYQVNYGVSPSVGGSVTAVDGDGNAVPNGGYVIAGGSVTYTAAANSGYTFVGWCNNESYGDPFTNYNPWTNSSIAAASNAYAKFKSTNFVIYRSGDMSSDPRAALDDVESYAGGTISEAIEFRMRVNRLDYWYTLCLPFTVTAVKVWDEEDGQYYDIVPYWRTDGTYYTGHYIIRTPESTTDFPIANFDQWNDPSSPDGYLPSANTPYIIQWHDGYFSGKYISFFGPTGDSIPTSMNQGANTSSDETVNIYGNNSMTSGTVRDAYMLDPDYGSGGAWLRAEVGTDRTVLPFECFIRANATTTAKYRVLRRDMADTPTGWDTVSETGNKTTKVLIDNNIYIIREGRIYTIQGTLVKEGK